MLWVRESEWSLAMMVEVAGNVKGYDRYLTGIPEPRLIPVSAGAGRNRP
jgi:hypothetical protein